MGDFCLVKIKPLVSLWKQIIMPLLLYWKLQCPLAAFHVCFFHLSPFLSFATLNIFCERKLCCHLFSLYFMDTSFLCLSPRMFSYAFAGREHGYVRYECTIWNNYTIFNDMLQKWTDVILRAVTSLLNLSLLSIFHCPPVLFVNNTCWVQPRLSAQVHKGASKSCCWKIYYPFVNKSCII